MRTLASLFSVIVSLALVSAARANIVLGTYAGASGNVAAEAQFTTDGSHLFLVLTNTATVATAGASTTLDAIFIQGTLSTFTPVSAVLTSGSAAYVDDNGAWDSFTVPGGVVGGEWGTDVNFATADRQVWNYGISSTGLNIFGAATFPGANLAGPANGALDGNQFGLISAATVLSTPANDFSGNNQTPVVATSVTFDLGAGSTLGNITGIRFQYGTADQEGPPVAGVPTVVVAAPLPSAIWAGLAMLLSVVGIRWMNAPRRVDCF